MSTIHKNRVDIDDKGIERLKHDAIETVIVEPTKTVLTQSLEQGYAIRTSPYKIKIKGENILRRVYLAPIGNTSVVFIRTKSGDVFCEAALDEALNRGD